MKMFSKLIDAVSKCVYNEYADTMSAYRNNAAENRHEESRNQLHISRSLELNVIRFREKEMK